MTELSQATRQLLSACAEAMSHRQEGGGINLYPLNRDFLRSENAIVAFLTEEVERITQGRLTVRRADRALLASQRKGHVLTLAVCPVADAPDGELVTGLNNVTLYTVGPYGNGFRREQAATPRAATSYRALVAAGEQKRLWQAEGQQSVRVLMVTLFMGAQRLVESTRDIELQDQLRLLIAGGPECFTIEQAAIACVMTGTDLNKFIFKSLSTYNPV